MDDRGRPTGRGRPRGWRRQTTPSVQEEQADVTISQAQSAPRYSPAALRQRIAQLPRLPMAVLPTPLQEAPRLSAALGGPRILIKRDDLTGFGFGGNKVRGLEFYLADARAQQADVIVTGAGPQSNHIRATAAAARVAGMGVVAPSGMSVIVAGSVLMTILIML